MTLSIAPALRLFTHEQRLTLIDNARQQDPEIDRDPFPVVKLFFPGSAATWLLTEMDPEDEDTCFGLCDLGLGEPELGYLSLAEICSVRTSLGLTVEQDTGFKADKPLSEYTRIARQQGAIMA